MQTRFKLLAIDDLTRAEHTSLTQEDACFYFMDYTAHAGWQHSKANSIIWNFKKPLERANLPDFRFKESAIKEVAQIFRDSLKVELGAWSFVPMPPSKIKTDLHYDGRVMRCLQYFCPACDIRELLYLTQSMPPSHHSIKRASVAELMKIMAIDHALIGGLRPNIIIVDDVLTTGAHFKAAKNLILQQLPTANVVGVFIGRTSR